MNKIRDTKGMASNYDFSKGVRGKYAARFAAGSNIAVIDADLARIFPDSDAVNRTLRLVAALREVPSKPARPRRSAKPAAKS